MSAVPYRRTFGRLLSFLRPYRRGVVISIVFAVGSQAAQIALIWVTGRGVIDQALVDQDTSRLWLYVGAIAGLGLASSLLMLGRRLISGRQALDVEMDMRQGIYSHLVRLSFGFYDRHQTGQLMSRATVDLQGVRFFLGYGLIFFFQNILTVASVTVVLFFFEWRLALVVLAVTPFIVALAYRYSHVAHPTLRDVQQKLADVSTVVEENIVGVHVVKAFAQEPAEEEKFRGRNEALFGQTIRANRQRATRGAAQRARGSDRFATRAASGTAHDTARAPTRRRRFQPGARPRDHLPLTRQRGAGDPPTFARPADAVVVGHASPVEEDLVEVDLAAEMAEGPDGHARLVHVEQEVRDALALRGERVGACEEHGPVGAVRPRGPDLLARDRPLVAIGLRPGGERRQVRPRARLAEQLAPALLVAHDRGQEPSSLRLRAVGEQRRRGQVETERVEAPEVVGRQHALDDSGDSRADVEAAVPGGPGWDDQARTSEHGVPGLVLRTRTGGANSGRTAAVTGVAPGVGHVLRDPGPHPLGGGIGTGVGTDRDAAHQVAPGTGHRLIVP